ncbi:hypothetical protein CPB85DRAFT_204323 [Mucidula mucida]|nr:hypothetical protein CPB85DRAFT_204323 [Mucidula mucida]
MSQTNATFVYPRPSIPQHQDPVPSWLCERLHDLDQLDSDSVQHRASLDGLHNTLLNCYFPATANFMVKPIPCGRNNIPSDETSPGFVVCKSGADLHADIPIFKWEFKWHDPEASQTEGKAVQYRAWISADRARRAARTAHLFILTLVSEKAVVMTISQSKSPRSVVITECARVLDPLVPEVLSALRAQYE